MRKPPIWRGEQVFRRWLQRLLVVSAIGCGLAVPPGSWAGSRASSQSPQEVQSQTVSVPKGAHGGDADASRSDESGFGALIQSQIQRLREEVEHTRVLVANGTLARLQLQQAEERLQDAEDQGVLAQTLYSSEPIDRLTPAQGDVMVAAAQRRVDRQSAKVLERRKLLENGAISQAEFDTFSAELDDRKRVLGLAQKRMELLADLRRMAETEKLAERAASSNAPATVRSSMIRYNGNGLFTLADIPTIAAQFERRFHHPLPVSALGQTLLHQSLRLDHRNRVDVAISPSSEEGLWLRGLLEKLHVPYLAFSNAVPGAATAPHIHIGVESTRLKAGIGS